MSLCLAWCKHGRGVTLEGGWAVRAHSSPLQARSSHWSINAAVMGTLPELHYGKKKKEKEKNTHCICCKDRMMLQFCAGRAELTNTRCVAHRSTCKTTTNVPVEEMSHQLKVICPYCD